MAQPQPNWKIPSEEDLVHPGGPASSDRAPSRRPHQTTSTKVGGPARALRDGRVLPENPRPQGPQPRSVLQLGFPESPAYGHHRRNTQPGVPSNHRSQASAAAQAPTTD